MIAPAILGLACIVFAITIVTIAELRDRRRQRDGVRAALKRSAWQGWRVGSRVERQHGTKGAKGR